MLQSSGLLLTHQTEYLYSPHTLCILKHFTRSQTLLTRRTALTFESKNAGQRVRNKWLLPLFNSRTRIPVVPWSPRCYCITTEIQWGLRICKTWSRCVRRPCRNIVTICALSTSAFDAACKLTAVVVLRLTKIKSRNFQSSEFWSG